MSSSSDSSSEPNLPSEEDDEEDVNPTNVFTQPEPIPKTQEFRGLLSDNGSTTTSGGSLSTTSSSSSSDNEHEFEDREDDPDMKLILSALDKTDSSTMKLQNKTFSDQKVRDIERTNSILMNRILSHNRRANRYTPAPRSTMISSSAVNRQKQQRQIDRDNLILLKKIQQVKPTVVNKQKR